jgi:hypothetical protein
MEYESNPKYTEPWQIGKKGSICEREVRPHAARLLAESRLCGEKRYAVFEGKAFCAQQHGPDVWHGYPIGWAEVPAKLALEFQKAGLVSKRDRKKYKETH